MVSSTLRVLVMPLPLLAEQLLSLSQAARKIPPYRGRQTNPSTIFRWLRAGVKLPGGAVLKLEGIRLAGRWLTSVEAIERFLAAQNAACNPDPGSPSAPPIRTPGQRRRASERAAAELEKLGI
jgi:uncharacterized protein DUF1580